MISLTFKELVSIILHIIKKGKNIKRNKFLRIYIYLINVLRIKHIALVNSEYFNDFG